MIPQRALLAALVASATGQLACSEIVGIEERSGSWCTLEAADSDFCEDFDHEPPFSVWSTGGSPRTTASDRSEPNALLAATGTTLRRSFPEARGALSIALDLRFGEPKADFTAIDHAVMRVSRGADAIGLFTGPSGRLVFGRDPLGEQLPTTLAGGQWKHFVISIDGDGAEGMHASLAVDGETFETTKIEPQGEPEPDGDKGTSLVIGAEPVVSGTKPIECIIDNVTVDGAGVAP